jgi:hypothetical protein
LTYKEISETVVFVPQLAALVAKPIEFTAVDLIAFHQTIIYQRPVGLTAPGLMNWPT